MSSVNKGHVETRYSERSTEKELQQGEEIKDEVVTEGSKLTRSLIGIDKNTNDARVQDYIQKIDSLKMNTKGQDKSALGDINEEDRKGKAKKALKVRQIRDCNKERRGRTM